MSWGRGFTERALIGAPSAATECVLYLEFAAPRELAGKMGDSLSAEVQTWRREGASRENKVVCITGVGHNATTVSSYGNRPAVFKISERLRNILKYVVAAVITSVTIFVVISSTLDLSRVETEQCMLHRELL